MALRSFSANGKTVAAAAWNAARRSKKIGPKSGSFEKQFGVWARCASCSRAIRGMDWVMEWNEQDAGSSREAFCRARSDRTARKSHALSSCENCFIFTTRFAVTSELAERQHARNLCVTFRKVSHFCEKGFSSGIFDLNMVYSNHNRMLCRTTFAVEGHAKANSHRVHFPDCPPLSSCRFLGNHPIGRAYAHCCKVVVMKAAGKSVQPLQSETVAGIFWRALSDCSTSAPRETGMLFCKRAAAVGERRLANSRAKFACKKL